MSTEHQKYSTENQGEIIRRYAEHGGIRLVRTYADHGKSGLRFDGRDALKRLIDDVRAGRTDFNAVLVYDVSRWGRFQDADESAYYEFLCKQAGIIVHYCAEQFENDGSLTDAYERKSLPGNQVLAIRRIIEQRRATGKGLGHGGRESSRNRKRVSAESLVRAYRKETQRQTLLVKRATLSQTRLLFVVNALHRLLADEHFVTLLRAEGMLTLPRPLAERLRASKG